ncbi:MAG: hypothetical protein IBJ03_07410 [Gemmatimonadaceae bacterium]|nr:hypothetical protein [Gemmatimonadaceae bacterium]
MQSAAQSAPQPTTQSITTSSPVTISGCWEGALYSAHGSQARHFVLHQPTRSETVTTYVGSGITLVVDNGEPEPVQLLDGAARSMVALAERAHLLIEARLRGDGMVGHWVRRGDDGNVEEEGELVAGRV